MKNEDRVLFLAARQDFDLQHQTAILQIARAQQLNWERILQAAAHNGVGPLIYRNLAKNKAIAAFIPQKVLEQNRQYTVSLLFIKQERASKLEQTLELLDKKGLRAIILKGAALDFLVYDQPWYTVSRDIDLMISAKTEELNNKDRREIRINLENTTIEYDFYGHHDFDMNGMLPVRYDEVWQRSRPVQYQNARVWILSPEDFLISLCINSCRKRFFRLKSLIDIAETIQRLKNLDWNRFCKISQQFNCPNITYAALEVTRHTVGCVIPPDLREQLGISVFRARLITTTIHFLLQFISITFPLSKFHILDRWAELTLLLPYVTYQPRQILYAIRQFIGKSFTSSVNQY